MMQTDSSQHTIDYWIYIHHGVHLRVRPLCPNVNAKTVARCVYDQIVLLYKLNEQLDQWSLCQIFRFWLRLLEIINIQSGF